MDNQGGGGRGRRRRGGARPGPCSERVLLRDSEISPYCLLLLLIINSSLLTELLTCLLTHLLTYYFPFTSGRPPAPRGHTVFPPILRTSLRFKLPGGENLNDFLKMGVINVLHQPKQSLAAVAVSIAWHTKLIPIRQTGPPHITLSNSTLGLA